MEAPARKKMKISFQEEDRTSSLQKDDSYSKAQDLSAKIHVAKQKTTKSVRYFNEEGPFLSSPKM